MDVLTDLELTARGWSAPALLAEIRAGRLRGREHGTGFSVAAADLDAWHASPAGQAVSRGTPVSGTGPARQHSHHAAPANSSGEAWRNLVEQLIASGTPPSAAARHAERRFPGGRSALVAETNAAAVDRRRRENAEASAKRARLNAR